MIDTLEETHELLTNFQTQEGNEHMLFVPKELINRIESELTELSNFKGLVDNPYIIFGFNEMDHNTFSLYRLEDDNKIYAFQTICTIHNHGVDFIVSLQGKGEIDNLVFPVLSIKKRRKLNIQALKEIFKKRPQTPTDKVKDFAIAYDTPVDIYLDAQEYKDCKFSLHLENALSKELFEFSHDFFSIWKEFPLRKYPNLRIYFNKDYVEDGIIFDIENCKVDLFDMKFIQNRLFYITEVLGKPTLWVNDIYFSVRQAGLVEIVNKHNNAIYYDDTDSHIKVAKTKIL